MKSEGGSRNAEWKEDGSDLVARGLILEILITVGVDGNVTTINRGAPCKDFEVMRVAYCAAIKELNEFVERGPQDCPFSPTRGVQSTPALRAQLIQRLEKMRDYRKLSSGFYSVRVDELLELLVICEGILELVGPQPLDRVWEHELSSEEAARVEEERGATS